MGKRKGKHVERGLSAVQVRALAQPGRYADGNGLYLAIERSGAKRWILRTVVRGKRSDMGLGGLSLVSLAEARQKAIEYRKIAREGGDPLSERRRARFVIPTFTEAAERVHAERNGSWRNQKHAQQWISTLRQYVYPILGEFRVDQIDTPDLLKVLSPIWLTKPETARRVRQRIGTVLDWAKAAGYRKGDNPVDAASKGLPKQTDTDTHHAALPYSRVPDFIERLRVTHNDEIVRLAFEFLILTAARTGEVIGARSDEVNLEEEIWTVPAARMKTNRQHRVPLAARAMEILHRARELSKQSDYVFPGRSEHKTLSNMVFLMALRRMNLDATVHGFRSSFRDWAAEQTSFPREVCEAALAHTIENKVEAAYRRGDLFEKRRQLMQAWAEFLGARCRG